MNSKFDRWESAPPPPKEVESVQPEQRENVLFEMAMATRGKRGRVQNEDIAYIDPDRGLFFVADGMGGSSMGGALASRAVVESVLRSNIDQDTDENLKRVVNEDATPLELADVESAINVLVTERMRHRVDRYRGTTDTTLSFGKFWQDADEKRKLTLANIGDSRIYRYRGHALEQLTTDDSVIQRIIDLEIPDTDGFPITDDQDVTRTVSLESLEKYGQRDRALLSMLTYAKELEEDKNGKITSLTLEEMRHFVLHGVLYPGDDIVHTHDVEKEDVYLATSDGIHDNLTDDEIQEIIEQYYPNVEKISSALVEKAMQISKDKTNPRYKPDDMTVSVVRQK